jgi:hypothetical protein
MWRQPMFFWFDGVLIYHFPWGEIIVFNYASFDDLLIDYLFTLEENSISNRETKLLLEKVDNYLKNGI